MSLTTRAALSLKLETFRPRGETWRLKRGSGALPAALVTAAASWMAVPANAANIVVGNEAQLSNAISTAAAGDTITFSANITLTANLPAVTRNVTINGAAFTLSGNNQYRGLFVQSGTVAVTDLTIANAKAQGGNGGNGGTSAFASYGPGGGGGAGLGGALFVAAGANVTATNVRLLDGMAVGGNGGSNDSNLCCANSGGGGSYGPSGADGGNAGRFQSGNGGAPTGGAGSSQHTGGFGEFGGGGGGGFGNSGQLGGGNGGFGGGGGGAGSGAAGGGGLFGGGGRTTSGGGGAGLGGAIFVQEGGSLTLGGPLGLSGNKVSGGASNGGQAGAAAGPGIFLHGSGTLRLAPEAGQTQTISDAVVDQKGAGGGTGSWSLVKAGAGTTILATANAYTGDTTVNGGVLRFAADASLGTSPSIKLNGGSIGTTVDTPANASIGRKIELVNGGIDVAKNPLTWSGVISGAGQLVKSGDGELLLTGTNTYTGGTKVTGGRLRFTTDANLGAAGAGVTLEGGSIGTTANAPANTSINRSLNLVSNGGIDVAKNALAWRGNISGAGQLIKSGDGDLLLTGNNTYSGGTLVTGGVLRFANIARLGPAGTAIVLNGGSIGTTRETPAATQMGRNISLAGAGGGISVALHPITWTGSISGSGQFVKSGDGELWVTGATSYTGGTLVARGTLRVDADNKLGAAGTGVTLKDNGALRASETFASARNFQLVGAPGAGGVFLVDGDKTLTLSGIVGGSGGLTKLAAGTLVLTGANTYGGWLNINGGTVQGNTSSLHGAITFDFNKNNPIARSVTFDQGTDGTYASPISGVGSLTKTGAGKLTLSGRNSYSEGTNALAGTLQGTTNSLQGNILNNATVIFDQNVDGIYAGQMTGTGALIKNGTGKVNLTGTSSVAGGTTLNAGGLAVNGKLTSNITINKGGTLSGVGNIKGSITNNGGTINPGNSIGHLTIDGNFTFNAGTLAIEIDPQGDSDRISVVGADHKVMINAGLLQLMPQAGLYVPNTTYTIITTEAGGTVWLGDVAGGIGFLTPKVSLNGGVVSVSLVLESNAFRSAGQTVNQQAVGGALDALAASGSVGGIVTTMANLPVAQGGAALQALSGQPYADFGTLNTRASQLFMNAVGRQMATERGAGLGGPQRVALAEACDVACDTAQPSRFGAWLAGIGSTGSVLGDANASGFTYTMGGTAFGIDYRLDPRFVVGIAGGYTSGTQWVDGFSGNGYSDAFSVALYGSFTQNGSGPGFYADALAGYANASNRLQRVIALPGSPTGLANGNTSANQFLGQIETGYKFGLGIGANSSISPFARLQIGAINQAGFTEYGGGLFNLAVAAQTTTSVRTTFGVDLAGGFEVGGTLLDLGFRLGWMHEFADTARPMTAAFAAAPTSQFTVFGATPQRDSAVVGFSAATAISDRASLFVSYDGEIGGGTDNHALRAGFRITW